MLSDFSEEFSDDEAVVRPTALRCAKRVSSDVAQPSPKRAYSPLPPASLRKALDSDEEEGEAEEEGGEEEGGEEEVSLALSRLPRSVDPISPSSVASSPSPAPSPVSSSALVMDAAASAEMAEALERLVQPAVERAAERVLANFTEAAAAHLNMLAKMLVEKSRRESLHHDNPELCLPSPTLFVNGGRLTVPGLRETVEGKEVRAPLRVEREHLREKVRELQEANKRAAMDNVVRIVSPETPANTSIELDIAALERRVFWQLWYHVVEKKSIGNVLSREERTGSARPLRGDRALE